MGCWWQNKLLAVDCSSSLAAAALPLPTAVPNPCKAVERKSGVGWGGGTAREALEVSDREKRLLRAASFSLARFLTRFPSLPHKAFLLVAEPA